MTKLVSTNPADNYSVVGEVIISSLSEITEKVKKAQAAKIAWKELGVKRRIDLLRPICEEFASRQEEIAELITKEIGKPMRQTRSEAKGYIEKFGWFINNVESAIKDEITFQDKDSVHKIVYEPFGVAAVITPWNYPFGIAIWGIVPNLLVGKQLSGQNINLIWFTGSSRTGKSLYKIAADKFIKAILEMGGSNPCIVFEDVDIVKASEIIYSGRFENCGQSCDATKRLIVHQSIVDKLSSQLKKVLKSKQLGDPRDEKTDIGSLVAQRQLDLLKEQVDDASSKGAKIIAKLVLPDNLKGAFYPPTILGDITKDMRVWKEEVFGPVLPIVTFKTEQEAIELANDTPYGLGSRVLSKDKERAQRYP